MKNYGEILKKERQSREISQTELAKAINITQQAISNYENNKNEPTIGICERIADFYKMSLDDLFEREPQKNY